MVRKPRAVRQPFQPDPHAIYLTDNGAAYCGNDLGFTAKTTGRDLSGQRIMRLSADDAAFWKAHSEVGALPKCETCRKEWTV